MAVKTLDELKNLRAKLWKTLPLTKRQALAKILTVMIMSRRHTKEMSLTPVSATFEKLVETPYDGRLPVAIVALSPSEDPFLYRVCRYDGGRYRPTNGAHAALSTATEKMNEI